MRIKILVRKNLRMSPGKIAAQAVHAALALPSAAPGMGVVVLNVSNRKFTEAKETYPDAVVIRDAGLTEVAPGIETVMAFFVETQPGRSDNEPACRGRRTPLYG